MQYLILDGGNFLKTLIEENTWGSLNITCVLGNNLLSRLKFLSVKIICSQVRTCLVFKRCMSKYLELIFIISATFKRFNQGGGCGQRGEGKRKLSKMRTIAEPMVCGYSLFIGLAISKFEIFQN